MKSENIQRYVSEKIKLLTEKKKIRGLLGLIAFVMIINSIHFSFPMRFFQMSFWIWIVVLLMFSCWTIAFIVKADKSHKDDLLYEGATLTLWSFAVISFGIKIQIGWGYIRPIVIFILAAVIIMLNVVATVMTTRNMLSREKYVSPQTDTKEPNIILAFVGGTAASGITSAIFTQDMRNTIAIAGLIFIASLILHLGCRYCYKVYLIKRYCPDIVINNQPEQVKIADRLDIRK